jgi:threonyl-tRNA synthetase
MVHRVILGAIERFLGVLVEHYAGAFPTWLAPVQTVIVTVSDGQLDFARKAFERLRELGVRVELDDRNEKLGYKIREAQMQKIPYMLVIGDREVAAGGISPRRRDGTQLEMMGLEDLAALIERECLDATKGKVGTGII